MQRSGPFTALSPSTGERENRWQSRVEHISGNFLRDGHEFVAVSRDLLFSPGAVRWCMVIHDETRAALSGQETLIRRFAVARNWICIPAHASHAKNPLIFTGPLCKTAKPLPTTAMLPLSK